MAARLLEQYGSLHDIYAHIFSVEPPRLRNLLTASEADARISYELVTLKDQVEIEWDPGKKMFDPYVAYEYVKEALIEKT